MRGKGTSTSLLLLLLPVTQAFQVRYCNRGYCYTKQCDDKVRAERSRSQEHVVSSLKQRMRGGEKMRMASFEICTDTNGHVVDCDLLKIIDGYDGQASEDEAVEWAGKQREERRRKQQYERVDAKVSVGQCATSTTGKEAYENKWPHPGHCFSDEGQLYDCNLLETLSDGLLLIEDLRVGGFRVMPQRDFSMKRLTREPVNESSSPAVVTGSGASDPTEHWMTMAYISLEGI